MSEEEKARAGERLRDALRAASDVMTVHDSPVLATEPKVRRAGGGLLPLAAAASMVVIVLAAVLVVGHFTRTSAPSGGATTTGAAAPPEFYLVYDGENNHPRLDVHRTSSGAVTDSAPFHGYGSSDFTADASDRAFYFASHPTCAEATPVTRFYRITINDSGRITGEYAVGSPVSGVVKSLAVSPDGSQLAYANMTGWCENPSGHPLPQPMTAIHVMDLSTGTVRTWQNTVTTPGPDRVLGLIGGDLSWTPDGRTVVAVAVWGEGSRPTERGISVLGLDTTGAGGSLQADSRVLLSQNGDCVTCVQDAIGGPDGSLTAIELKQGRQLVVRIPLTAGGAQTVLYSAKAVKTGDVAFSGLFADPTGRWVITWPPVDASRPGWKELGGGWIQDGELVPLPGSAPVRFTPIAW